MPRIKELSDEELVTKFDRITFGKIEKALYRDVILSRLKSGREAREALEKIKQTLPNVYKLFTNKENYSEK
jgi:hypothetical protein